MNKFQQIVLKKIERTIKTYFSFFDKEFTTLRNGIWFTIFQNNKNFNKEVRCNI
jgi:hypothetical protein